MSTASCRVPSCKFVTVGDGAVGKTALLTSYTANEISPLYVPTVFDTRNAMTTMDDGKPVSCVLYDSAGQEDYDRLRVLSYPQTDCFLLCFSLTSRTSFENIVSRWAPELEHNAPGVPILLVGTKSDLRGSEQLKLQLGNSSYDEFGAFRGQANQKWISTEEGQRCADEIGAFSYVECSAVTQENLAHVFKLGIKAWLHYTEEKKKRDRKHKNCGCEIM